MNSPEKLQDPSLGEYRFGAGDYRIIFDVEGNTICVLRVGHRKENDTQDDPLQRNLVAH